MQKKLSIVTDGLETKCTKAFVVPDFCKIGLWRHISPVAAVIPAQAGVGSQGGRNANGGVFTIDSADDCLHAGGEMTIAAGTFTLSSGDDAVHCDDALAIRSGAFTISYCYEGIEGLSITIEDGVYDITSHDDGLNAAGGADSSGFGSFGGRPQDSFTGSSDSFITINGGTFTIVSGGDSIDSNGDLTINGGTLDLTCNGAGDTALDCDGTYANNGGDVTTNDGSESNPGQMGGGMGGGGDMGGRPGGQTGGADGRPGGGTGGQAPDQFGGTPPEDGTPPEGGERPDRQQDGGQDAPSQV